MREYIVRAIAQETIDSFDAHNAQELIRCKDCKNGEKVNSVYLCGKSRGFGIAHEPDYFCADGEQKYD